MCDCFNMTDPVKGMECYTGVMTKYEKWLEDEEFIKAVEATMTCEPPDWLDFGGGVTAELIGKYEVDKMLMSNYPDEEFVFPYNPSGYWANIPRTMGFEFTSSQYRAFANGDKVDEGNARTEVYTDIVIFISEAEREYAYFSRARTGSSQFTFVVSIWEDWTGEDVLVTHNYICRKVTKFSWE